MSRDKYGHYVNDKGVEIKASTSSSGKDKIDIYDSCPAENKDHGSIHINFNSNSGTGTITDTTSGSTETTSIGCYLTTACMRHMQNKFDDIYMPKPNIMRIEYNGKWYEIEQVTADTLTLPADIQHIKENENFKITEVLANPLPATGYSVVTATDYFIKLFSSISPAYEQTIDELMLSQGADTITIFTKATWIPKFPFTYAKKYYINLRTPNNGPLSDVKKKLKNEMI